MGRRFHIALGVADLAASIADYSSQLDVEPECIVPGVYALWGTPELYLSIRLAGEEQAGQLRHLGWEKPDAASMVSSEDINGILWEQFSSEAQRQAIKTLWGAAASFAAPHTQPDD